MESEEEGGLGCVHSINAVELHSRPRDLYSLTWTPALHLSQGTTRDDAESHGDYKR